MTLLQDKPPADSKPAPAAGEPLLLLEGVSKAYRIYRRPIDQLKQQIFGRFGHNFGQEFWALKDISLQVRRGETIGLIGRNGSGKSTLLQIIAGILQPTKGRVQLNGKVAAMLELGSGFNPEYSGRDNVFINGSIAGVTRAQMQKRFEDIEQFADIGEFIDRPVKTYSSGMFMRLGFAVATSMQADLLLIDEALAVGDVFFRQKCYQRLENLRRQGASIVLASHAMNEIEQFCKTSILLDKAQELFQGPSLEAVRRYYLLQQPQGPKSSSPDPTNVTVDSNFKNSPDSFWPRPQDMLDISRCAQVTSGWARCSGVALTDESGQACHLFRQGQTASFFYEFELLHDIDVPVAGVVITNDRGIIAHGRNTMQLGTSVPVGVAAGSKLRFRHDITIDLEAREYTFEVGISYLSRQDYERRLTLSAEEFDATHVRMCHLPVVGSFGVTFPVSDDVRQVSHFGVANLRSQCQLNVVPPGDPSIASAQGL